MQFSTVDLPIADRFDAWRQAIGVIFDVDRAEESRSSGSFTATLEAFQFGSLLLTVSSQGEQNYRRLPGKIRSDDIDHYLFGLYQTGGYRGEAKGVAIEGGPGDVQVLDLARPMATVEEASSTIALLIPRERLEGLLGDTAGLHGIDLRQTMGPFLADYLGLLAKRLPTMTVPESTAVARATYEIFAACLRPSVEALERARPSIEAVLLVRAKSYIAANLAFPGLSPDHVSQELRISRRTLYRLFEPMGGVHHYIRDRRLALIHAVLVDSRDHRRIAEIAALYGFDCKETFWRSFQQRFGRTPGDVRAGTVAHASAGTSPVPTAHEGFDDWIRNLHA